MNPEVYRHVLVASLAGGVAGALVMWNRHRAQVAGTNRARQGAVLLLGTLAFGLALYSFTRAFAVFPMVYAMLATILITGFAAVLQSATALRMPQALLCVTAREAAVLQAPWTGVRLFGKLLRRTPLRYLGGPVFLANTGGDLKRVLAGVFAAETVHLWAMVLMVPWFGYWIFHRQWGAMLCSLLVHVPLNLYPVLHLRHTTARLKRLGPERTPGPLSPPGRG